MEVAAPAFAWRPWRSGRELFEGVLMCKTRWVPVPATRKTCWTLFGSRGSLDIPLNKQDLLGDSIVFKVK